ncbi:MAG TPA: sigma-70 family RNA polymerase sigma factor [Burkholderiales bacterium]|nr:sigma-70 family RNA polymerase sigma factor [Burkholderiales bacterium]
MPGDKTLEFETHRPALLKFAMLQLRNQAQAEDAVQETLIAAIQGAKNFGGKSSVRTWLVGILKHKIVDLIRRSSREQPLDLQDAETSLEDFDVLYKEDGHYVSMPAEWGDPEKALSQRKFFETLERCLQGLPKNTARVFMMREVLGIETGEICKELAITATNCWVLLYRARMGLRVCLEERWFSTDA